MLGLLTDEDKNLVKSSLEPLPLATVENYYGEEERGDEEQDLFTNAKNTVLHSTLKRHRSALATVAMLHHNISNT